MGRYAIHTCSAILADPELVPDRPGLYAILLEQADALDEACSEHGVALPPVRLGRRRVIYVGASQDSLRLRLKFHFGRDARTSTFRMTLGALLARQLQLRATPTPGKKYFRFGGRAEEGALTAWLKENVSVAVAEHADPFPWERRCIGSLEPLLNIRHQPDGDRARRLVEARDLCAAPLSAGVSA